MNTLTAPPRGVAVLGAGLAGLSLAWELTQLGVEVTLYERSERPGGVIRSEHLQGFVVEHGAQLAADRGELSRLAQALGLELSPAAPEASRRYVVRDGALEGLDGNPLSIVKSKLLSARGKLRAMAEPMIPRRDAALGPESVADFVRRRLGDEALIWGVEPFVGGTLLGDVEALEVDHCMAGLARMEREHGSLLRAGVSAPRPAPMRMVTVQGGMQRLTDALAHALGPRLILQAAVHGVARLSSGFELRWSSDDGVERRHRVAAICSTLPGHSLIPAQWPSELRDALLACQQVHYSPVTLVALGYRREQVAHPLDGLGVLVPAIERRNILASLFSSTVTPAHAPPGHVCLTTMLGGARQPELAELDQHTTFELVRAELAELLGVSGQPSMSTWSKQRWALPQPELGFSDTLRLIERAERACPGITLGGSLRDGAGVPAALNHARERAASIAASLS